MFRALLLAMATTVTVAGFSIVAAPAANASPPYANCKAAAADGRYNITRDDPAYRSKLDRDDDGIACESH